MHGRVLSSVAATPHPWASWHSAELEGRLTGSLMRSFVTWLLASQATVVAATAAMLLAFR